MTIDHYTMTTAQAARVLDLCVERVRQLDDVLKPVRTGGRRGHRRYDPAAVTCIAEERARTVRGAR